MRGDSVPVIAAREKVSETCVHNTLRLAKAKLDKLLSETQNHNLNPQHHSIDMLPMCITENTVRIGRHTAVSFVRTLRIPQDGRTYALPAGFGKLPIYRVSDYADKVPPRWLETGGFFIPLYQREALYLEFEGVPWRPTIAKVAVGMVNAITGKAFNVPLRAHSQDYVVIPNQQWLDGINAETGVVGQFVAMPLGKGYTVEEQITDEAKHGGFQLMFYDSKRGKFPERDPQELETQVHSFQQRHQGSLPILERQRPAAIDPEPPLKRAAPATRPSFSAPVGEEEMLRAAAAPSPGDQSSPPLAMGRRSVDAASRDASGPLSSSARQVRDLDRANLEMGIAAGGSIQQQIIVDPYGCSSWDEKTATPLYIHIVNSMAFELITGMKAPPTPITDYSYKKRGLPWYSNYDESVPGIMAAKAFKGIKKLFQIDQARGISTNEPRLDIMPKQEQIRRIHVESVEQRTKTLWFTGEQAFRVGNHQSCIERMTMLLDLSKGNANALLLRAQAYAALGQHHLADLDSTEVIETDPRNVNALLIRARANLASGWPTQAQEDANRILRVSPLSQMMREAASEVIVKAISGTSNNS